jgi:putative flippase GtrA
MRANPKLFMTERMANAPERSTSVRKLLTMRGNSDEATVWPRRHRGRRNARFVFASVASTAVSFTVISLVYGLKVIRGEVDATLYGNLVGAIPSYSLNRRWVWRKSGKSHLRKEVTPFCILTLLGIAFSIVVAAHAHLLIHEHQWSHLTNTAVVDGANLASVGVFWILKFLVFSRIFRIDEEAPIDQQPLRSQGPR